MGAIDEGVCWERQPTEGDFGSEFRMWRCPDRGEHLMVIWSDDIVGVRVHYFHGRTTPHRTNGCEACSFGREHRWKGYVLARLSKSAEKVLLEFTPPAGKILDREFANRGTLKGLQIVVSRPSQRLNGKVHVRVAGIDSEAHTFPRAPKIVPILHHIWGMTTDQPIVAGGMAAQLVSQAEIELDKPKDQRSRRPLKVPTTSFLAAVPTDAVRASPEELLDAIARSSLADQASIARVNGRRHA